MAVVQANGMINLDADQTIRSAATVLPDGSVANKSISLGGNLVPEQYDAIELTYVAAGNGAGEIETVTYKLDTVTIATLTLSYDVSNRLIGVVRS